jgi:hypothetical protein
MRSTTMPLRSTPTSAFASFAEQRMWRRTADIANALEA